MQLKTSQGRRKSERRREKGDGNGREMFIRDPGKESLNKGEKLAGRARKRERETGRERARNKNERRERKRCELFQFVVSRPADPGSRIALWKVEEKDRKGYISDE